ncbi:DNA-binding protein [Crenobacter cavernae]|uniref:KfrA N-terminal DNA-binding domain-containing protein n=1 Tax=Crenobacter cavernae TaxID=2290923 RepID=A0A345Y3J2_9NEIS|nr:DNA-binding protein [Crenobacter cavernae]AXK38494.1 hypothetical protein DWG20_03105 [Crenobacter cavernae]
MPRAPKISQQQVDTVAAEMQAIGEAPTVRAVRSALGAGSNHTVAKLLNDWKSRNAQAHQEASELPAGVRQALGDWVAQAIATATAALRTELATTQQDNSDVIAESERLAVELDEQTQGLNRLATEKAELLGRLSQLETELELARKAVMTQQQAAEAARSESTTLRLRLEALSRLENEVERRRKGLEEERARRIAAEQAVAVGSARLDATEAQVVNLQRRLTEAENEAKQATREAHEMRGQLQILQGMRGTRAQP